MDIETDAAALILGSAEVLVADVYELSPLNGLSRRQASRFVNKVLRRFSSGLFSDEYWKPVSAMFKELTRLGVDYSIDKTEYLKNDDGVPSAKVWTLSFEYVNDKERTVELRGTITASGAGSVKYPLDRYDLVAYVN